MISCNLDLESDGKRTGSLDLRYSDNRHAFSKIPVPITVIRNGSGPTLLLTAGNHGDEYEGQVILRRIIHETAAKDIAGRLIILPALNYPAVLNGSRVSPLDQGNLNRSFPGSDSEQPTSAIAHFISTKLLPLATAGIDLHSGGSTSYYLPSGFLCKCKDPDVMRKSLDLIEAFNAPYAIVVDGSVSSTGFDPIAHGLGVPFISAELSGGGNIDTQSLEIAETGLKNIFHHLGIQKRSAQPKPRTCFLDGIGGSMAVDIPYTGIFEPAASLGDEVSEGELAGVLYSLEEVDRQPLKLFFPDSGVVMVRRNGASVKRGDYVFLTAREVDRNQLLDNLSITH